MTLKALQAAGYKITEDEVARLHRVIIDEYKVMFEQIKNSNNLFYGKYLTGGGDKKQWPIIVQKANRLSKLKAFQVAIVDRAWLNISETFIEGSKLSYSNSYYRQLWAANWALDRTSFSKINKDALIASVLGQAARLEDVPLIPKYGKFVDILTKNKSTIIQKLDSTITQAILQGKDVGMISKEISDILNISLSSAERIARTETMRNLNSGVYSAYKTLRSKGVDVRRKYIATFDTRTRKQSSSMDGQIADLEKGFKYPNGNYYQVIGNTGVGGYDVNDRCSEIQIINGFNPELRSARNPKTNKTELISWSSFDDWMESHNLKRLENGRIV